MGLIKINNVIYGSNLASDIVYKGITVEEKLDTIPVFDPSDNANIEANQYDYLTYGHIVDNLNNSASDKVLSANQGKILSDKIVSLEMKQSDDKIHFDEDIEALDEKISINANNITSNYNTLNSKINTEVAHINRRINTDYGRAVYISPSGDDETGKGTSSSPWKTFARALENDVPMLTSGSAGLYTIYVAAGTYTDNLSIYGKSLRIYLQGNVTIKPANTEASSIVVSGRSKVEITASSETKPTLTLNGCTYGFNVQVYSVVTITNLSNITISNATNRIFHTTSCSYFTLGSSNDKVTIGASNTGLTYIATSAYNSCMILSPATFTIQSGSQCSSYAFYVSYNGYMFLDNCTIPSSYAKGLQAAHCGKLEADTVTNNATTPGATGTGGTIV